jgi:hypothetical protein
MSCHRITTAPRQWTLEMLEKQQLRNALLNSQADGGNQTSRRQQISIIKNKEAYPRIVEKAVKAGILVI